MVFIDIGLNRVRDLVFNDIDKAQLGTDGTAASITDTDLVAGDANAIMNVVKTKSDRAIKLVSTLLAANGTTGTYKEHKFYSDANGFNYDRTVFTGQSFVSGGTEDVIISKIYFFRRIGNE